MTASRDEGEATEGRPDDEALLTDDDEHIISSPSFEPESWVQFARKFFNAQGAPQILVIGLLMSIAIGATIGIVPAVLSDRYARIIYGYDGTNCSTFERVDKPDACQRGADDAQSSMALTVLAQNLLTLCSNSTIGSVSDVRGRKPFMVLVVFLSTISASVLVLIQLTPMMDPMWYYIAYAPIGLVNWMSIAFSMLSDVMPPLHRAPSFGLFLAAFYIGISFSPSLARLLDHYWVSIISLAFLIAAFLFAAFALPETLPREVADRNLETQIAEARQHEEHPWVYMILRPIRETTILNRDPFLRLLTMGAFFSGMVYSSDANLILYYIEDQLNVRDVDLSDMFLLMGGVAVAVQGFLLQYFIAWLGDKGVLVASFACGTLHNLLYGVARSKGTIYVALCLSQLTKANFPVISSMASKKVNADEQGRMQGAIFAVSALANASGPISLEWVYNRTKNGALFGPGTMFLFASLLYGLGTVIVSFIPSQSRPDETETSRGITTDESQRQEIEHDMEEPLLAGPE